MPKQIQPIQPITEQTFEKLKFKYGSVIGENFKLIGSLGRYVIDWKDFEKFAIACTRLIECNSENLKYDINTINDCLQNHLKNPDYKEDFKMTDFWTPTIDIEPCLTRLDSLIDEINYAITSVSKYSVKIDPSKKLTKPSSETVGKIIQVYHSESLVCPSANVRKLVGYYLYLGDQNDFYDGYYLYLGDQNDFYDVLHSSYFTEEGAQQIENFLV